LHIRPHAQGYKERRIEKGTLERLEHQAERSSSIRIGRCLFTILGDKIPKATGKQEIETTEEKKNQN